MGDFGRTAILIGLICMAYLEKVAPYYQYPSVYWAPKNCRFNLNKAPHEGYEFKIKPNGNLFFVCPNLALWDDMSSTGPQLSMMYENLMLVDKEGYETCTVNKTRNAPLNRLLLKCNEDAKHLKYMEETFSPNRAGPTQMKYKSGTTYYFISTSDGSKKSLDNLSGGHCRTHNMKLKIHVCDRDEICPFKMPKCPYTYVFDRKRETTTASTTHAQTTESTLSTTTEAKEKAGRNQSPTTQHEEKDTTVNVETEEKKVKKQLLPTLTTESPTQPKVAKHSSNNTIWGSQRKHIIIHITMALLILVLALSLVYIVITRRKQQPKRKDSPVAFSSKLYQERPTSTITIPLNLELNGDAQAL